MASKVSLEVNHIWQLDPDSHIPISERRNICAPVVVKMVLDYIYHDPPSHNILITDIISSMQKHGGRVVDMGWKHSAGVATLVDYGMVSWRRNWRAPSQDPQYFIDHEGYSETQVQAFLNQLHEEEQMNDGIREKALYSIYHSIDAGLPVIASVLAGFSENEAFHQVVISGYDTATNQLEIIDPLLSATEQKKVSLEYFWEYFKLQAIFVLPKS